MTRRPATIVWAEYLVLLGVLLRMIEIVLNVNNWGMRVVADGGATTPAMAYALIVVMAAIPIALALWTTRSASRVALWLFVVWIAQLAIVFVAHRIGLGFPRTSGALFSLAILVIYLIVILLLFTSASRRWFRAERTAEEIARDFA
jgi:hypothetical protein